MNPFHNFVSSFSLRLFGAALLAILALGGAARAQPPAPAKPAVESAKRGMSVVFKLPSTVGDSGEKRITLSLKMCLSWKPSNTRRNWRAAR